MGAERSLHAISRIERALARIDAAGARAAPERTAPADARLEAAHARLRMKVEAAISDIDAILETAEG
jgi:hypothetical protein